MIFFETYYLSRIGNSKPLPAATVMPGGRKASVARTFEKIEEVEYPPSVDIGDHNTISPVLAPESVYSKGNDETDPEVSVNILTDSFDGFDSTVPIHSTPVAEKADDDNTDALVQKQPIEKQNSRKPSVRHTHLTPPSSTQRSSSNERDDMHVGRKIETDSIDEHHSSDGRKKKKKHHSHTTEGPTSLPSDKQEVNSTAISRAEDNVSGDNNSNEETVASDTLAPLTPSISPRRTFTANIALKDKQRGSVESLADSVDEHKADVSLNDESVQSVRSHGGRVSRSRTPTAHRQNTAGDQSRIGSTGGMSRSSSKDEASLRADSHYRSLMSTLLSLVDIKANVKKELKDWAVKFQEEHNRPPGNEDKAAISDRFLAYKMVPFSFLYC